jgi:hypothetical protein
MTNPTVVLLGNLSVGGPDVGDLVREFGWSIEASPSFDHLRQLSRTRSIVAVLFDSSELKLAADQALRAAHKAAPNARLISCHRFSEPVDWPVLAEAGAFHALALPLDRDEVRQSLGFVWSARLRRPANVLAMPSPECPQEAAQLRDVS